MSPQLKPLESSLNALMFQNMIRERYYYLRASTVQYGISEDIKWQCIKKSLYNDTSTLGSFHSDENPAYVTTISLVDKDNQQTFLGICLIIFKLRNDGNESLMDKNNVRLWPLL